MKEVGSPNVYFTEEGKASVLFAGLSDPVNPILAHKDSVTKMPDEFVTLAYSDACSSEAYCYKSNVYGVLFHPELDLEAIEWRLRLYPEYLTISVEEALKDYIDSDFGESVLKNFVSTYYSTNDNSSNFFSSS